MAKLQKVSDWDNGNSGVYQLNADEKIIPFEFAKKVDRLGTLYCVECSYTGYFEAYGLKKVIAIILKSLVS